MGQEAPTAAEGSVNRRALLALRELRARLETASRARSEAIAIVGLGCRLPGGAATPEGFWELLAAGRDAVGEIPASRRELRRAAREAASGRGPGFAERGAFLDDVDGFDPEFFGISPREAPSIDPQHRLLLEVAHEAFEAAGLTSAELRGSRTGVFVGITANDYSRLLDWRSAGAVNPQLLSGNAANFAAGRLAYCFGLRGPALAIDTACSSSLVAVHQACQALRAGECDAALAAGVNLVLAPEGTLALTAAGLLSPDGRCKTFDATADGYVRGEGCGAVVLVRQSDALVRRLPVQALVRGSAVNQDGPSGGLTVPSSRAQQGVIEAALDAAGVEPREVSYVEAHGTGTALGDPIEVRALWAALGRGRPGDESLAVGSVKANIGHLESAAGITGLIKTVLCLQHRELPPQLHLRQRSPDLDPEARLHIPTELSAWKFGRSPRLAGVSSFGGSGTNAHVILEEAPPEPDPEPARAGEAECFVLPISARREDALGALVDAYRRRLGDGGGAPLRDLAHTASLRRNHFEHRLAAVAGSREELLEALDAHRGGGRRRGLAAGVVRPGQERRVAFVFAGHGSLPDGAGRELLAREDAFRQRVEECDEAFRRLGGPPVLEQLLDGSPASRTELAQPALFSLQVGLAALWRAWGIEPGAVVGHSVGEVAAAHVAGALRLGDAARVIVERARLLRPTAGRGAMASVGLARGDVEQRLAECRLPVEIAAENGPANTVVSGDPQAVAELLERLAAGEVLVRRLAVEHAFHSRQVEPLREPLELALSGLAPRDTSLRFVSALRGAPLPGARLDASYWAQHLREPVRFLAAAESLVDDGYDTFVEIGGHPVLLLPLRELLEQRDASGVLTVHSLRRGDGERRGLLESLARLHTWGCEVDWAAVQGEGRCVPLPSYPWQRRRYWLPTGAAAGAGSAGSRRHTLLGARVDSPQASVEYASRLGDGSPAWLAEHRLGGRVVAPGAAWAALALAAAAAELGAEACRVEDLDFLSPVVLGELETRDLRVVLAPGDAQATRFQVFSRAEDGSGAWTEHAAGRLRSPPAEPSPEPVEVEAVRARCAEPLESAAFYTTLERIGAELGPRFRWIERAWRGPGEILCELRPAEPEDLEQSGEELHPGLLDSCFQSVAACLLGPAQARAELPEGVVFLPLGLRALRLLGRPQGALLCHTRVREDAAHAGASVVADFRLFDVSGRIVAEGEGLCAVRTQLDSLAPSGSDALAKLFFEERWDPAPLAEPPQPAAASSWLILNDSGGLGDTLADRLEGRGQPCVRVERGAGYARLAEQRFRVDPECPADLVRLLEEPLWRDIPPRRAVLHLWTLDAAAPAGEAAAAAASCIGLLHLVQALVAGEATAAARLRVFTRRARHVADGDAPALAQSAVWGLCKTVAHEHPELRPATFDLDTAAGTEECDAILAELDADDAESGVALRGSQRFAERFVRCAASTARAPAGPALRPDATYLVSGGTGGLGLTVADWLVRRGARHLALLARSAPTADAEASLSALRKRGAEVTVQRCDVSDRAGLAAVLAELAGAQRPLRGVVHAAGIVEDGILIHQSAERFRAVLAPKVAGASNLDELTSGSELDFFICFSSLAGALGSPAQANYSAANAFLGAFAHQLRAKGRTALCIDWGPWSEVGMLTRSERRADRLAVPGVRGLATARGLAALEHLLALDKTQVAVVDADVERWAEAMPGARHQPVLSELVGEVAAGASGAVREELAALDPDARQERLLTHLRERLASVLQLESTQVDVRSPLGELGFDSLAAVELKADLESALGAPLSATLMFSHPTLESLAPELLRRMGLATEAGGVGTAAAGSSASQEIEERARRQRDALRARRERIEA